MLRYDVTVTSATVSQPLPMNLWNTPFNTSLLFIPGTASVSGTVQHTMMDPYSADFATGAVWVNHATMSSMTATSAVDGNYAFPVSAIRLNMGAGTGRLIVTQQT